MPTTVPPEAVAALSQGNKIEAIKIVRRANRTGLMEAKEAVEAYVLTQPTLQVLLAERQEASKRTLMLWLILVVGAALLLYLLFRQ